MNEIQKEIIAKLVYTFAKKVNNNNQDELINVINRLCSMDINDSIDAILVSLNDLLNRGLIKQEDIFFNVESILKLNPEKYTSPNDLIKRLNWILAMNMAHPNMSLAENHQLVIDAFDRFNELIGETFDCYYTGGLMGYLTTGHELERYHGDLDLLINEQQLILLKKLVDSSPDFDFVCNMDHKEVHGHEYKIVYKDTKMSIGLFLFERQSDNSITTKEYYFENENINGQLFVDEHHFSKEYTKLSFSNQVREHNGIPYRMMSLENIYNSKKNSRPKDRYDAQIIKEQVDMMIDYKLDVERKHNFDIKHKKANQTAIEIIKQLLQEQKNKKNNENFMKRT